VQLNILALLQLWIYFDSLWKNIRSSNSTSTILSLGSFFRRMD